MLNFITANDLIEMLKREAELGNGDKLVKIPKTKFKDIEKTTYSSDIGMVDGLVHGKGNCILLQGD